MKLISLDDTITFPTRSKVITESEVKFSTEPKHIKNIVDFLLRYQKFNIDNDSVSIRFFVLDGNRLILKKG